MGNMLILSFYKYIYGLNQFEVALFDDCERNSSPTPAPKRVHLKAISEEVDDVISSDSSLEDDDEIEI